ncbi:MAG: hypothetical protein JW995_08920 [Melioribacteraceae bacterium]|nr:hypothetical protein [Melioribacteraceae bacterium]
MVRYAEPLSDGWNLMKKALFKPFDIKKWFIVGFTAFLAGLTDCAGGGGGNYKSDYHFDAYDFFHFPETAYDWLLNNMFWTVFIIFGIIVVIGLIVLFTWLSSRGKFAFLNNVVHDKMEVVKPWYEYSSEGNSLFLWRLVYGLVVFMLMLGYFITGFIIAYNIYSDEGFTGSYAMVIVLGLLALLATLVIFAYIESFLDNFIVPIMYRNKIGAVEAWRNFLELFTKNMGAFLLFGLFKLGLVIALIIAIIIAGFFTCCMGFILLIIPYIRDVVLLPFSYTFRAFSLYFLEQFGEQYKIFPTIPAEDSEFRM